MKGVAEGDALSLIYTMESGGKVKVSCNLAKKFELLLSESRKLLHVSLFLRW